MKSFWVLPPSLAPHSSNYVKEGYLRDLKLQHFDVVVWNVKNLRV